MIKIKSLLFQIKSLIALITITANIDSVPCLFKINLFIYCLILQLTVSRKYTSAMKEKYKSKVFRKTMWIDQLKKNTKKEQTLCAANTKVNYKKLVQFEPFTIQCATKRPHWRGRFLQCIMGKGDRLTKYLLFRTWEMYGSFKFCRHPSF